ncbi:MAG TPA: lipid A biosynthesis protein [Gammaproteobacteria bacterium]|nr:lipid A biosynthesis protein [Gammaproteobacteria bacterium]
MFDQPVGWLVIGFAGQALFSARFLVQWVYSERRKRSLIPIAFWYFSLAGGATLFTYALHIGDPVFILGQSLGVLIYTRNLYFIHKERQRLVQAE